MNKTNIQKSSALCYTSVIIKVALEAMICVMVMPSVITVIVWVASPMKENKNKTRSHSLEMKGVPYSPSAPL